MKSKLLLSLFCLLFSVSFLSSAKAQVNQQDSLSLVDFYNSTGGPHWFNHTNWLTTNPVSTWYGIHVDNNRVTRISFLSMNRISGPLPQSIGNLDSLRVFEISDNYNALPGNLPASIFNLHKLDTLSCSECALSGTIPSTIGSLDSLQYFDLSINPLSGTIPNEVGKLKALQHFNLSLTGGISGTIPAGFGNCTALTYLNLGNNLLKGMVPASFKKLVNLQSLLLGGNQLSGVIKDFLPKSAPFTVLALGPNQFTGIIPTFVTTFTSLRLLDLDGNQLTGTISPKLSNLQSLTNLNLSHNNLTGHIPSSFSSLKQLINFDLSFNQLSGDLPEFLFHLPKPVASLNISLNDNQLTYHQNPQYNGKEIPFVDISLQDNLLTYDGLEFFTEKYGTIGDSPQGLLPIHINGNVLSVYAGGTLPANGYHWYMVGNSTPTDIFGDSTFQPSSSGQYYATTNDVKVKNLILMTDTVTFTKNAVCPTSLASNELKLFISPNPVRDRIQITGLNDKANAKITLADMSGYVWMSTMTRNQTMLQLDVSRLKPGNYLINVNDEKGAVKTIQFVKE